MRLVKPSLTTLLDRKETKPMEPLEVILDKIFKKLDRAERTIHVIDCIAGFNSVSEREKLEQIKAAIAAYYDTLKGERT